MLKIAARTTIPLRSVLREDTETRAEFVAFDGIPNGEEHVALLFDQPQDVPLVRVHSECLTGDIFHSLRCDCRAQLVEALACMEQGGGVLLYLRQEGRGIGLSNKLKAYHLQESGADTYEANRALGLADDARDYDIAAQMLRTLEINRIRLLTNNPAKVTGLTASGIEVTERISTQAHLTSHNAAYLKAKADHGHQLPVMAKPDADD